MLRLYAGICRFLSFDFFWGAWRFSRSVHRCRRGTSTRRCMHMLSTHVSHTFLSHAARWHLRKLN
jgi:hypothetical protein